MTTVAKKQLNEFLLCLLVAFLFILLHASGILHNFELKSFDLRFKIRGPAKPHPDIAMVDIADDAIEDFGSWPFPRHIHGMFIEAAKSMGASQIVYDVHFSKPTNPQSDQFLGHAAAQAGNTVFGLKFLPQIQTKTQTPDSLDLRSIQRFALKQKASNADHDVFSAPMIRSLPIAPLVTGAFGMGFINTYNDPDGVCRRAPAVIKIKEDYFLQLVLPGLAQRFGADPRNIEFNPGKNLVLKLPTNPSKGGNLTIPLDDQSNVLINWIGGWKDLKHYSFRDIVLSYQLISEGKSPVMPLKELQSLENKLLVVGLVGSDSHDYYPTPFEREYFLAGMHLNLAHTILTQSFIQTTPLWIDALLITFACLICFLITFYTPPKYRLISFLLYLATYLVFTYFALFSLGVWVKAIVPGLAISFAFETIVFSRYLSEFKSKKQAKQAFQRYVTKEVMEQLLEDPGSIKPGGENKEVSIFFSDIRGFTSMSEKHTPEEMVQRLNEYLGIMTEIIFRFRGTIDKFVGDEIMAYFGAPLYPENHATRAVHAAIIMKQKMEELEAQWEAENKAIIRIGIGINTGQVVMGNVGSDQYMDFTLIGDEVNLGARLCSSAEPNEILLSEATYRKVSRHVEVIHAREITVKGKEKPVKVYSIMNFIDNLESERRRHKRIEKRIPIRFRPFGSECNLEEVIVDLSGGGFKMNGVKGLQKGQELQVEIPLPNDILVQNVVATVLASGKNTDGKLETRALFTEISPPDRDEIIKLVYLYKD